MSKEFLRQFSPKVKEKREKEQSLVEIELWIDKVFTEFPNSIERIKSIKKDIELILKHLPANIIPEAPIKKLNEDLEACAKIENKREFASEVLRAVTPVFLLLMATPKVFEEARAKAANERQGYKELSRVVTYEKKGNIIELHHPPGETLNPFRLYGLYREGMRKLAKIIEENPEIEKIEAVSWFVHDFDVIFTKNGFTVEKLKEVDEEGREMALAYISREDFLEHFGIKDTE